MAGCASRFARSLRPVAVTRPMKAPEHTSKRRCWPRHGTKQARIDALRRESRTVPGRSSERLREHGQHAETRAPPSDLEAELCGDGRRQRAQYGEEGGRAQRKRRLAPSLAAVDGCGRWSRQSGRRSARWLRPRRAWRSGALDLVRIEEQGERDGDGVRQRRAGLSASFQEAHVGPGRAASYGCREDLPAAPEVDRVRRRGGGGGRAADRRDVLGQTRSVGAVLGVGVPAHVERRLRTRAHAPSADEREYGYGLDPATHQKDFGRSVALDAERVGLPALLARGDFHGPASPAARFVIARGAPSSTLDW